MGIGYGVQQCLPTVCYNVFYIRAPINHCCRLALALFPLPSRLNHTLCSHNDTLTGFNRAFAKENRVKSGHTLHSLDVFQACDTKASPSCYTTTHQKEQASS